MSDALLRVIIGALSVFVILLGSAMLDLATSFPSKAFGAVVLIVGALGVAEPMRPRRNDRTP